MNTVPVQLPRIVIIGGGFAGLYCGKALKRAKADVTLIDKRNFHLFQPLLYQVATGGLSPANIAAPLRSIFTQQKNIRTLQAEVTGFEISSKTVLLKESPPVPFDYLVLAAGGTNSYFGKDHWEELAPGLKTIEDATRCRRKILSAFERAELTTDPVLQKRLLTFVVIGGGPTGVEMAGSIAELARITMRQDFRHINPTHARVVLVEGHERVLPMFVEVLSRKAKEQLESLGVEVINSARVQEIHPDHVVLAQGSVFSRIETETVLWAAGVKSSPLGKALADAVGGVMVDRAGRVPVGPDCSVAGQPNIFVLGDLASQNGADGKPLPGLAPVAMQQGDYVAHLLMRRMSGETEPGPFKYLDKGTMATIGRSRAVADAHWIKLSGKIAWLAWLFVHIMYLAKFSNRMLVLFQWFWNYITRNRSARLITGDK
jgi:NADH:ubiquinone reductase (H+-translocating)